MTSGAVGAPVAVICAMADELVHLADRLPAAHYDRVAGRSSGFTRCGDQPVVLALCGVGMLSAAAVTEAVIARWSPSAVINYGCTGAHRPELLPGDIVIGDRVVAYLNALNLDPARTHGATRYLRGTEQMSADYLPAAPHLLAAAGAAAGLVAPDLEPWPADGGWPVGVDHRRPEVSVGTVSSADRWNVSPSRIARLAEEHGSLCEDMEAAAIATTCASHDVPFVTVKDISNNELLDRTESESWASVRSQLGRRAASVVYEMLAQSLS